MKTTLTTLIILVTAFLTVDLNAQTFEMVKDLNPYGDSAPRHLTVMDNHLFFVADINNGQWTDLRLWVTDGTEAGTQVIDGGQRDLVNVSGLTPFNGELYFSSASEDDDKELWKTDANGQVTLVKNINSALYQGSAPTYLTVFDNKIYFSADDGTNGRELWVSDGTKSGTQMLKDINSSGNGNPKNLLAMDNYLFFIADFNDGHTIRLAKTDGTTAGTQIIPEINNGGANLVAIKNQMAVLNGEIYMSLSHEFDGYELWKTDGNTFEEVKNIENSSGMGSGSGVDELTTYNGKVYFSADDGTNGYELWVTDGTTAGTQMLKDINPSGGSHPMGFTEYNGKLYFSANDGTNGHELWVTDGTTAGTQMLIDINPSGNAYPKYFTEYNGKLYFKANDGTNEHELFETDGTADGTQKIQPDITTTVSPLGYTPYFKEFDGSLYFTAEYDANGVELWKLTANMSVEEITPPEFSLYPNPVKDILQIKTNQEVTGISLYSLSGQELQTWKNQDNIDLSAYAKGIYLVKIQTPESTQTKKIIKK